MVQQKKKKKYYKNLNLGILTISLSMEILRKRAWSLNKTFAKRRKCNNL